jgi:uncharacterized membrane protein
VSVTISAPDPPDRLNNRIAWLLSLGTWVSCSFVAAGMVMSILSASTRSHAERLVSTGIVLLIALPTLRVATMGMWFLLHRDHDFALIAALVLVIIIASTLIGAGAA